MGYYDFDGDFPRTLSAAERKKLAEKSRAKLRKKGEVLHPVTANGRGIAKTIWGKSWCLNLARLSDYESRLPRGRSYLRNGSVLDLKQDQGVVRAKVQGSRLYDVEVRVTPLSAERWQNLCQECQGNGLTALQILQGKLSEDVMRHVISEDYGLFPLESEIRFSCTCPDWADMCKHIAATMYGLGPFFDEKPEAFFSLRGVDPAQLASADSIVSESSQSFAVADLNALFGIDIE